MSSITEWSKTESAIKKVYFGKRTSAIGAQRIKVLAVEKEYDLPHIEKHSPDGFNWGYGGSGPADTALSILTDFLGDQDQAERFYQDFKCAFVANIKKEDDLVIHGVRIHYWMQRMIHKQETAT